MGWGEVWDVPSGTDFTAIAAGAYTGYALKSDGSIMAWGDDGEGEISGVPSGTNFTAIAGGALTGYALRIPEPASAGLLSLGGLILFRRRGRRKA